MKRAMCLALIVGLLGGVVVFAQGEDPPPKTWEDSTTGLAAAGQAKLDVVRCMAGCAHSKHYPAQLAKRSAAWKGVLIGCDDRWVTRANAAKVGDLVACMSFGAVATIDDATELGAFRAAVSDLRHDVDQELAAYVQALISAADADAARAVSLPAGW